MSARSNKASTTQNLQEMAAATAALRLAIYGNASAIDEAWLPPSVGGLGGKLKAAERGFDRATAWFGRKKGTGLFHFTPWTAADFEQMVDSLLANFGSEVIANTAASNNLITNLPTGVKPTSEEVKNILKAHILEITDGYGPAVAKLIADVYNEHEDEIMRAMKTFEQGPSTTATTTDLDQAHRAIQKAAAGQPVAGAAESNVAASGHNISEAQWFIDVSVDDIKPGQVRAELDRLGVNGKLIAYTRYLAAKAFFDKLRGGPESTNMKALYGKLLPSLNAYALQAWKEISDRFVLRAYNYFRNERKLARALSSIRGRGASTVGDKPEDAPEAAPAPETTPASAGGKPENATAPAPGSAKREEPTVAQSGWEKFLQTLPDAGEAVKKFVARLASGLGAAGGAWKSLIDGGDIDKATRERMAKYFTRTLWSSYTAFTDWLLPKDKKSAVQIAQAAKELVDGIANPLADASTDARIPAERMKSLIAQAGTLGAAAAPGAASAPGAAGKAAPVESYRFRDLQKLLPTIIKMQAAKSYNSGLVAAAIKELYRKAYEGAVAVPDPKKFFDENGENVIDLDGLKTWFGTVLSDEHAVAAARNAIVRGNEGKKVKLVNILKLPDAKAAAHESTIMRAIGDLKLLLA